MAQLHALVLYVPETHIEEVLLAIGDAAPGESATIPTAPLLRQALAASRRCLERAPLLVRWGGSRSRCPKPGLSALFRRTCSTASCMLCARRTLMRSRLS